MKIRFLHKLCKELHKKHGHKCCCSDHNTDINEDTDSVETNDNETQ